MHWQVHYIGDKTASLHFVGKVNLQYRLCNSLHLIRSFAMQVHYNFSKTVLPEFAHKGCSFKILTRLLCVKAIAIPHGFYT